MSDNNENNEVEVVEKATTANMKKYFKSPEDAAKATFDEYQMKRLKKIIKGDLVEVPFLFKTDFKFAENFEAPMLFLGSRNSFWKEAVKDYKKEKTYASGLCTKVVNEDGSQKLEMQIISGKGGTALNLKKINKILLKKFRIVAEFVEGKEEKKGILETVKDVIESNLGISEKLPENGVVSASTNIISRIQVEIGLLKAIPTADVKEKMDKIKLIEILVKEWEMDYSEDKDLKEQLYVQNVKNALAKLKNDLNKKDLKKDTLDEIEKDYEEYIKDRDTYINDYKKASQTGTLEDSDLDFPEDAYKTFYQELNIQLRNIKIWRNENLDASTNLKKQLDALELKIRKEQEVLATKVPNIEKVDKNQQEIQKIYNALQLNVDKYKSAQKASEFLQFYKELKSLEQQAMDWETAHPSADKGDLIILKSTRNSIAIELKKIISNIPKEETVDSYEVQELKNLLNKYLIDKDKVILSFNNIRDRKKEAEEDKNKTEEEKQEAEEERKEHEMDVIEDRVALLYTRLDEVLSASRAWKKENLDATKHDLEVLTALEDRVRKEYTIIENFIPQNKRDKLYKNKGYNPKELENLAEHTQLPKISNKLIDIESGHYGDIMEAYRTYQKMPADDVEAKRLILLEMTTHITAWVTNWNKKSKFEKGLDLLGTSREKDVLIVQKEVFEIIKKLGAFGVQRDNFLDIKDKHREFKILAGEYESHEKIAEEKDASGLFKNNEKTAYHEQKEDLEDRIEILIDEIEALAQEWQRLHNNLSGFGTKEKNSYVEEVRKDIYSFSKNKSLLGENPNEVVKNKKTYKKKDANFDAVVKSMKSYASKVSWKNSDAHYFAVEAIKLKIATFNFYASICEENEILKDRKKTIEGFEVILKDAKSEIEKQKKEEDTIVRLKEIRNEIIKQEKMLGQLDTKSKTAKNNADKEKNPEKKAVLNDEVGLAEKAILNVEEALRKLYAEWVVLYPKANKNFQKKYAPTHKNATEQKQKREDAVKNMPKEEKDALNTKIGEKDKLFIDIINLNAAAAFAYESGDEKDETKKKGKIDAINALERKIKDWDNIAILATDNKMAQKYSKAIKELQLVQEVLTAERAKFEKDAKVKVREDVLFANIELQFTNIEKAKENLSPKITKSIQTLFDTIAIWVKKNPNPQAIGCGKKYERIEVIKKYLFKLYNGDCAIYFVAEQFEETVARMNEYLDSFKKSKVGFKNDEIEKQKKFVADEIKEPKKDLETALQNKKIEDAISALKVVQQLDNKIVDIAYNMLIQNNLDNRKKEQLELSAFDGFDVYQDLDNMKECISEKDKEKIQAVVKIAVERADLIQELGGSADDAKRMLEHIPVAFWPDNFIESMRLWQQTEEAFYGKMVDEALADKEAYTVKDAGEKIGDVVKANFEAVSAVKDFLESGKFELEGADGKAIELNIFTGGAKGIKKFNKGEDISKEEKDAKELSKVTGGIGDSISIIESFIGYGSDVKNIYEAEGAPARAKEVWHFIINSTERIVNDSKTVLDSSLLGEALEAAKADHAAKIACAVLEGAALLIKVVKEGEKVGTEGIDAFIKKDLTAAITTVAESLIKLGSGVASLTKAIAGAVKLGFDAGSAGASTAGMVGGVAGVVVGAFATMSDALDLTKLIVKIIKDIHEKSKITALQSIANQEDSVMKHSLHREVRSMNTKIAQDAVQIGGKTVELAGSVTSTVGSVVSLIPDPVGACVGTGTGLAIAGTVLKISGKGITLLGQTVIAVVEEANRMKVEKLMVLARKGDRKARLEVLRNSRKYAKMFLSVGVMQDPPDPIALDFCIKHGITEKDLDDEATANKVLAKLMERAGESMDEASILTKISNTANGLSDKLTGYLDTFKTREIQAIQLNRKSLKSDVTTLYLEYKSINKKSIIYAFLSGLSLLSALAAYKLDKEAQKLKEHLSNIKTNLNKGISGVESHIDKLYKEMDDINKTETLTDELFEKCLNLEKEIEENEAFIVVIKESIEMLKDIQIKEK